MFKQILIKTLEENGFYASNDPITIEGHEVIVPGKFYTCWRPATKYTGIDEKETEEETQKRAEEYLNETKDEVGDSLIYIDFVNTNINFKKNYCYQDLKTEKGIKFEEFIELQGQKFIDGDITQFTYRKIDEHRAFILDLDGYDPDINDQTNLLIQAYKGIGMVLTADDKSLLDTSTHNDYKVFSEEHEDQYVLDSKFLTRYDTKISTMPMDDCIEVNDWWSFQANGNKEWLDETLKHHVLYHRKGKDWYVSPIVEVVELTIFYLEEGVEEDSWYLEEEVLQECFLHEALDEALDEYKVGESFIKEQVYELTIRSGIESIEDELGNEVFCELFGVEYRSELLDIIWKKAEEEYKKSRDYVWDIDTIASFFLEPLLVTLNTKMIRRAKRYLSYFSIKNGLVFSATSLNSSIVFGGDDPLLFVIIDPISKEEFHIGLLDEYRTAEEHIEFDKEFYRDIVNNAKRGLDNRAKQKKEDANLYKEIEGLFVSINDSIESGNCLAGTKQMIKKLGINPSRTGGVSAAFLLSIEDSPYTRRAVLQALARSRSRS